MMFTKIILLISGALVISWGTPWGVIRTDNGVEVEAYDTAKAVRRYNELASSRERVAAGLHLTC